MFCLLLSIPVSVSFLFLGKISFLKNVSEALDITNTADQSKGSRQI